MPMLCCHLNEGKPAENLPSLSQSAPELRARQVEDPCPLRHLIFRQICRQVLDVYQGRKRHDPDAERLLVFPQVLLGGIRIIEGGAAGVTAGAGMLTADDEVATAIVFADDGMPARLGRAGHAHGQRPERQAKPSAAVNAPKAPGSSAPGYSDPHRPASSSPPNVIGPPRRQALRTRVRNL
jgi:hypothetical protein